VIVPEVTSQVCYPIVDQFDFNRQTSIRGSPLKFLEQQIPSVLQVIELFLQSLLVLALLYTPSVAGDCPASSHSEDLAIVATIRHGMLAMDETSVLILWKAPTMEMPMNLL
jgi:hypothetical protein